MSTNTAEKVFKLIEELPSPERVKLKEMLAEQPVEPVKTKAPLDKRVPCKPMLGRSHEHAWVKEHKSEYAGQWVALDGARLVAASFTAMDVVNVIDTKSSNPPLLIRVPSPDDLPYIGI